MVNYAREYVTLCEFIPYIFIKRWNNGRDMTLEMLHILYDFPVALTCYDTLFK
jgi:hypothetical protein